MIEKRAVSTATSFSSSVLLLFGVLLLLAGGAGGYFVRDLLPAEETPFVIPELVTDDDPSWGPADAKVTIVEFAEFQCPYCRQWYSEVYVHLKEEYAGRIRFVYRDFPLDGHADAKPSAVAAHCAGEQDKYWEYFDMLFGDPMGTSAEARATYAQRLMLDMSLFEQCVQSGRYNSKIADDMFDAGVLGVRGVPAFYVNKRLLSGAQPLDVFKQAIDEELAAAD